MRAWVLTDGDLDRQDVCLGVAEAAADIVERRVLRPRAPWRWLAPWAPIDPRDAPERGSGPIAPRGAHAWPEIIVGAGRMAPAYLLRAKRASGGRAVTVYLGRRCPPHAADVIAVAEHEAARGPNVVVTRAEPHRVNLIRLAAARGGTRLAADAPAGPRVGVVIDDAGGRAHLGLEDVARLLVDLRRLRADGAVLLVRPPRGAPEPLMLALREVAHYLWDGSAPDPYISVLAQSEALVVSAMSTRTLSEAATTGAPILAFTPRAAQHGVRDLTRSLEARGVVRPFAGRLERFAYVPIDASREIAQAVHALAATRAALRTGAARGAPARTRETNGPAR